MVILLDLRQQYNELILKHAYFLQSDLIVVLLFTGRPSIFAIFMHYKFLTMRYMSQRNPYCRQVFYELRMVLQQYAYQQSCPAFLKKVINKTVEIVLRLAPTTAAPASAAQ